MGGPAGAVAGGLGGGLASAGLIGGGQGAQASGQTAPTAATQTGAPQTAAPTNSSIANPAALQLLLTLFRPEVVEALIAMVLGRNGASGVQIAGRAVPVAAVSNLIQSLSEAASASHYASGARSGTPRYLSEARGRGEDISASEVRSAALLELIHEAWDSDIAEASHPVDEYLDEDIDAELAAEQFYPGELTS